MLYFFSKSDLIPILILLTKPCNMKNTILPVLLCMIVLCTTINNANAQPANDDCSGAILISTTVYSDIGGMYIDVNTSGATASSPNPSCITSNDNNDDVWYSFVAQTQTELLRVHSAVAGSAYVTFGYALYDACGGTEMVCNNQMGTFHGDELLGGLTPGNTYFLRFWSLHNFTSMTFSFAVQDIDPIVPGNAPATPTVLTINDAGFRCISPQFFTTANATRSSPNPSCTNDNDDDVWFQFTCPNSAVNIYVEEGTFINSGGIADMGMEIIDATAGLSVSCQTTAIVGSRTSFGGVPGDVYHLRLWTVGKTDHAVFSICLQDGFDVKPPNDSCSVAQALVVGSGSCSTPVIGNLGNADITFALLGNPSCTVNTTLKTDVWYKATVPASGNITVQTSATNAAVDDLVLLAYTNNCSTFTQIGCDEDGNPDVWPSANHAKLTLNGRTPGETILYRVLPRNGDNLGQFSICAFDETGAELPSISIADIKKTEGNSGTKKFTFTARLSSPSTKTVKVNYKTLDGTATAPSDYTAISTTKLEFNPGDTAEDIAVFVNGDINAESNETFKIKLTNPINAILANDVAKATIKNDDGPSVSLSANDNNAIAASNNFKIYPNPANDVLHIDFGSTVSKVQRILIVDIQQRILKQGTLQGNERCLVIPIKELTAGTYFIKIEGVNNFAYLKFIKQ